jgi:hypothetical protein
VASTSMRLTISPSSWKRQRLAPVAQERRLATSQSAGTTADRTRRIAKHVAAIGVIFPRVRGAGYYAAAKGRPQVQKPASLPSERTT